MRRASILFLLFVCFGRSGFGQVAISADHDSLSKILDQVPTQSEIDRFKELLFPSANKLTEFGKEAELKRAKESLEQVKEAVPKLRKLIKVGHSVFEYPGLLSRGRISHSELTRESLYTQYIGVYLRSSEGSEPYDFEITFNSKGIIQSVKSVVWKH